MATSTPTGYYSPDQQAQPGIIAGAQSGVMSAAAQPAAGQPSGSTVQPGATPAAVPPSAPPTPPAPATAATLPAPAQWNVTNDQAVAGQMGKLADPNNPYYQQWAQAGASDAAARGFTGNSSIRDTAILDSVMRNATPIAQADAATYSKAAGYNTDQQNQFGLAQFNAGNQMAQANLSSQTQQYVSNLGADTQKTVAAMSNASQAAISQAHDANAVLLQSNQSASNAYSQYVQAVASIDQQPGMDMAAKQAAITTQTQIFNNAMAAMKGSSAGTPDLSSPLDVNGTGSDASGPAGPGSRFTPQGPMGEAMARAAGQVGGVDVSNLLAF